MNCHFLKKLWLPCWHPLSLIPSFPLEGSTLPCYKMLHEEAHMAPNLCLHPKAGDDLRPTQWSPGWAWQPIFVPSSPDISASTDSIVAASLDTLSPRHRANHVGARAPQDDEGINTCFELLGLGLICYTTTDDKYNLEISNVTFVFGISKVFYSFF